MGIYDEIDGFKNKDHQWLTYETLFNHKLYRRSNQEREMGLYHMPLENLRIVVARDIPSGVLDQLREAFFPDLTDNAQLLLCVDRPWDGKYDRDKVHQNKKKAKTHVVLPYNFRDNDQESPAIGTASRTRHRTKPRPVDPPSLPRAEIGRLKKTWPMWSTASRSCVVRIDWKKARGAAWEDNTEMVKDVEGVLEGEVFAWPAGLGGQLEQGDHTESKSLAVANLGGCFSLKSGVMYVGGSEQGGASAGGKATLEENSVLACLRSDYIADIDRSVKQDPVGDPDLLVLPEILTVTEDLATRPGDGFQVRDLSRLHQDKVYFPALSIPYVGVKKDGKGDSVLDFDTLAKRWTARDDDSWAAFWGEHYAAKLGAVKAKLLIRYGLQLGTPNAQNFLLEFDTAMKPTGRIVVRDLGDAMLHTEAIWALFGSAGTVPTSLKNVAGLGNDALDYECTTLVSQGDYYPGQTGGDHGGSFDYPAGTQFHWHFYSSLGKGSAVSVQSNNSTDPDARDDGWRQVLYRNAVWAGAHHKAYARCLESELGVPTIAIDWATMPDPQRYRDIPADNDQYKKADELWREDVAWERAQAKIVHDVLASADGQEALRRYRDRRWKPAEFTMRLVDKGGKPVADATIKHRDATGAAAKSTKTDHTGELRLSGHPGNYKFLFEDYPNSVLYSWLSGFTLGQHLDFDFIKIDIQPA